MRDRESSVPHRGRELPDLFVATGTAIEHVAAGGGSAPDDASDGTAGERPAAAAWLLRDLDLAALVRIADSNHPTLAVDVDTVEGLNADAAAVRFLVVELGVECIVSRRPALAVAAVALGAVGLAHVFAFDSTGLRRSLEGVAPDSGIGVVVSPGLVVPYLTADDLRRLPRPLVAYGLVERPEQALRLLEVADSVVVRPELALPVRSAQRLGRPADASIEVPARALDMRAETV